jgi:hypothetical protein
MQFRCFSHEGTSSANLTESELQSLLPQVNLSCSSDVALPQGLAIRVRLGIAARRLLYRLFSSAVRSARSRLLAGKSPRRWLSNPKVLFLVGESESFSHLPSVGTRYRRDCQTTSSYELGYLLRSLALSLLRPNRPLRFENYLPLPPPSLQERRIMRQAISLLNSQTSEEIPAAIAGVTRKD